MDVVYDPAWDMPKVNWVQQGSFEEAEVPVVFDPDEGPLVCLPPINQHWLPLVLGCLDQLRNPSTWITANDDAMNAVLNRANRLMQMFGERALCMSYEIRFDSSSCQLQQSVDGGATWTEVSGWSDFAACLPPQTRLTLDSGCTLSESFDGGSTYSAVPGWIDNFSGCVQEYVPVIGLPPNPGDQPHDQFACAIAGYLANQIVLDSLNAAVTAIQDDLTLLSFGANILDLIPEFVLVRLGYDAIAIIYGAVQEGTLSDYESALTDASLWSDVRCAIYLAIEADGYVTPDNIAALIANVCGISYSHTDVISAICSYITSLGAVGLAALAQPAGLVTGGDCSFCGVGWCFVWDFAAGDSGWSSYWGSGISQTSLGWESSYTGPLGQAADIKITLAPTNDLRSIQVFGCTSNAESDQGRRCVQYGPGLPVQNDLWLTAECAAPILGMSSSITVDEIVVSLETYPGVGAGPNWISAIVITGIGVCPFGTPNC